MRIASIVLLTISSIFLALTSLYQLISYYQTDGIGVEIDSPVVEERAGNNTTQQLLKLSRSKRQIADTIKDLPKRIALYCEALQYLGSAISREPMNSRYLINWANLRQVISDIKCSENYANGSFRDVLNFAVSQDPTSDSVIYSAALLNIWSGDRKNGLELFRKFITLSTEITPGQEKFIIQELHSGEDLIQLLPPQFPQVIRFSKLLVGSRSSEMEIFKTALEKIQLLAIDYEIQLWRSGRVPLELVKSNFFSLLDHSSSSIVRQRLDQELSSIVSRSGDQKLAGYLSQRSKLSGLSILTAACNGDTRPLRTNLSDWGQKGGVYFDQFYQSVGFFIPEGQRVNFIELVGAVASPAPTWTDQLKIFVSDNNQEWKELATRESIALLSFDRIPHLVMNVGNSSYRYWKLHFSGATRDGQFWNELPNLLRAFGSGPLS